MWASTRLMRILTLVINVQMNFYVSVPTLCRRLRQHEPRTCCVIYAPVWRVCKLDTLFTPTPNIIMFGPCNTIFAHTFKCVGGMLCASLKASLMRMHIYIRFCSVNGRERRQRRLNDVCATVCLAQTFGLHLSDHIWRHKSVLRLLLNYTKPKSPGQTH